MLVGDVRRAVAARRRTTAADGSDRLDIGLGPVCLEPFRCG